MLQGRMPIKFVLAVPLLTLSCGSVEQQAHSSILQDKGKAVRLILVDTAGRPLAGENVDLSYQCETPSCAPAVVWSQKSSADGSVTIPKTLIHETTLIGTRANEPREMHAASWQQGRGAWTLALMGRAATVCAKYDSSWSIVVADDWRSAKVNTSSELGLMHCQEGKDVFRICQGPQMPDAGFTATFTRSGNRIFARLTGETTGGPREFAQLDCFRLATGQAPPRDLKAWTVEYGLTGGIAGLNRHLRITQAGELNVSANSEELGSHITTHASGELMARIAGFLNVAQKARPASRGPTPDALNTSLALISGGSKYELEVPDNVGKLLDDTIEATLKNALAGTWRESEWKLCHPAAQLTAEQMDPPIESLVFQDDGKFSVMWRGGGTRVYGDPSGKTPHVAVPDYSGRYVIQPDHSRIQMSFESGIYSPRDFSGEGFFQVNEDKLVLKNVWLGTYNAKQKPDICEITFARTSEPALAKQGMHR